jgi:anti-sigma regulatory factor (Ser/Thr protein kinase)
MISSHWPNPGDFHKGNTFIIGANATSTVVDDFVKFVNEAQDGQESIIDFSQSKRLFPNFAVPLAAAIRYFESVGKNLRVVGQTEDVIRKHISSPLTIDQFVRFQTPLTDTVWEYRSEKEAGEICQRFIEVLTEKIKCEAGVIDTLNWCLYEVLDNVFQHSHAKSGFVMMQFHKNRYCAITVSDTGRGIHKSMVTSSIVDRNRVRFAGDAIEYALEQGVTSKGNLNQGNGLFGLRKAVMINGGRLSVKSGRGIWSLRDGAVEVDTDEDIWTLEPENHQGTTVDWQLDCANPVSIGEALGRADYESGLLESIEIDFGYYRVPPSEVEAYVGSRALGAEFRNIISNYLSAGAKHLVLDLSQIGVVSSSFADEVVGKLVVEMGELKFRQTVFFENVSDTNRLLIERAIQLRQETGV